MANLTVQDIILFANDLIANYTTGTIDLGNRMRALNRATEYVQTNLTLPSDKTTETFYFSDDQMYYDAPAGFNEPLLLLYSDPAKNKPITNWTYRPDSEILQRSGLAYGNRKYWGTTTINGKNQIVMLGSNLIQGSIINTFDDNTGVTLSGDANTPTTDTIIKYEGTGCLKFTITPSGGTASVKWVPAVTDWRNWHTNEAFLKIRLNMPSVAFSSINLRVGSSATDYYLFTATLQDDGTAFSTNNWNLLSFKFPDNPVIVGSPNDQAINFNQIDFVENGSIGIVAIPNFRMDYFYAKVPDSMDLIYLTNYKGVSSTGTAIQQFTSVDDVPSFATIAPDLLAPIAYRMAYILHPQLKKEVEYWKMYNSECASIMKIYGKLYPRQRIVTMGKTHLQRF